ncbi:MAG TPA: TonB-dependent receptor, partial [Gammaproteobacteria bacterium]
GDRAAGIPATSVPGIVEGEPAENDVQTYSLDYSHDALNIGEQRGRFHAQLFRQDFAAIYGGGTYGVFQGAGGIPLFDQSRNLSEKTGLKLTYNLPELIADAVDVTVGFDWLRDTTEQDLVQTGRTWVPETTYVNTAPFAQFNWNIDSVNLTAGMRHESAELEVDDFTTLAAYGNTFVAGGNPDFSETLFNVGANWHINPNWTLYATRSEGFSMPDVGRVLRGVATPGLDVDSFLNIAPIIADNRELGVQFRARRGEFRVSYFESGSDLGARLQPDADGIFSVMRERTEINGVELSAAFDLDADSTIGINYAHIEGEYDEDGDGEVDSDLGGVNVAPDRANIYWKKRWTAFLDTQLQVNALFDREFEELGVRSGEFDGYTTLDLVVNWAVDDDNRLQFGIENLLDEQYITYYSQTVVDLTDPAPPSNDNYFAGRGRNIYVTWRMAF